MSKHIITFKEDQHEKNKDKLLKHLKKHGAKGKMAKIHDEMPNTPRVFILENATEELLNDLRADQNVLDVEEDGQMMPHFAQTTGTWDHVFMDIPSFHSRGYTGKGVKVGYIDSGAASHEDLVYAGMINKKDSSVPASADRMGHGTRVAGIIGMRNNDKGYVGVAPDCLLYAVKTDDNSGTGGMNLSAINTGIEWLVDQGVKIINCSFGNETESTSMRTTMEKAYRENGVLFVCSAGNRGNDVGVDHDNCVGYPARFPFVIAVGNVMKSGLLFPTSSRGPEVDVCAPGTGSMTTAPSEANDAGTDYTTPSTLYDSFGGTSCAAPHVAGLAALYWQKYREEHNGADPSPDEIRNLIEKNVIDVGPVNQEIAYGKGLVVSEWNTRQHVQRFTLPAPSSIGVTTTATGTISPGYVKTYEFTAPSTRTFTFDVYDVNGDNGQFIMDVMDSAGRRLTDIDVTPSHQVPLTAGQKYFITIGVEETFPVGGNYTIAATNGVVEIIEEDFGDRTLTVPFTGDWTHGTDAAKSGFASWKAADINDGQTSQTSFKVIAPYGARLSFYYKVDSEANCDKFTVTAGGITIVNGVSGNVDWTRVDYTLPAGTTEITFKYTKDGSGSTTKDAAWIDELSLSGVGISVQAGSAPGSAPVAPTISVGSATQTSLTISMSASGASSYDVYRSNTSGGTYSEVASNVSSPYVNSGLAPGTTYYFKAMQKMLMVLRLNPLMYLGQRFQQAGVE